MKTEWGVDESLCIYCRKHWREVIFNTKCKWYDHFSNHCTDQVCMDCYEKEQLGLLGKI